MDDSSYSDPSPSESEPDADRFEGGPRPAVYERVFPAGHIDEDAAKVLRRLHRAGHEAYLVGGGVRDLLLGRKPKDFDVATSARPNDVKQVFRNCRIIGRRFRLAHILFSGGKIIETATFRRDPSASDDGDAFAEIGEGDTEGSSVIAPRLKPRDDEADLLIRHDNVFGEPFEDALRRDFTINGLFYDVERGEVIDYVGGMADLEARTVRTIGLPDVRFREDPVRMLRAIKFSARLDLGIDPEVYDALVAQREELGKAAKARVLEEILRLVRGGAAHRSIWLTWETGILAVILPELATFLDDGPRGARTLWGRLDAIDALVADGKTPSDVVLLAALLLGPIHEALEGARDPLGAYEEFMNGLATSVAPPRRMKERMRAVIGCEQRLRRGRIGSLAHRDFFPEAAMLYEIDCRARGATPMDLRTEIANAPAPEDAPRRRRRRRRGPG
ncbi:MAG: polynucleotide adenylyltransferase PcnB [Sandaracinus sp.]